MNGGKKASLKRGSKESIEYREHQEDDLNDSYAKKNKKELEDDKSEQEYQEEEENNEDDNDEEEEEVDDNSEQEYQEEEEEEDEEDSEDDNDGEEEEEDGEDSEDDNDEDEEEEDKEEEDDENVSGKGKPEYNNQKSVPKNSNQALHKKGTIAENKTRISSAEILEFTETQALFNSNLLKLQVILLCLVFFLPVLLCDSCCIICLCIDSPFCR